jgi:ABC-type bacteriocin/lantibiotic exporter with double-glycine peptidase domain
LDKKGDNIHLDIPKYQQAENNTCVPACLKMMVDYLNKVKLMEPAPELDEAKIAKIVKTKVDGTHFKDIVYLNKELNATVPSLEFVPEFGTHSLAGIAKELEAGLPVTVWILAHDSGHDFPHAVVITGIDDARKEITYNDPAYGKEVTISQSQFLSKWEKLDQRMIKAKIGRLTRPTLEQFMNSGSGTN